ncbi:MAG: cytidine deaminase [Actinobacteria bacterium]|nr:cytidine deaminase [Actinomycetota bacterium]
MDDRELIAAAREVAVNAYAPYSGFRVGAVVVDAGGGVHRGANVENSAYPSTVCAEAAAIAAAASEGARAIDTVAVACIDADEPGYPCGNCRQMMVEFGVRRVLVGTPDGGYVEHTLDELIPHGFKFAD